LLLVAHGTRDAAGAEVALRLVHASGMPDIVSDLRASSDAIARGRQALADGASILCDAEMTAAGITRTILHRPGFACSCGAPGVTAASSRAASMSRAGHCNAGPGASPAGAPRPGSPR